MTLTGFLFIILVVAGERCNVAGEYFERNSPENSPISNA